MIIFIYIRQNRYQNQSSFWGLNTAKPVVGTDENNRDFILEAEIETELRVINPYYLPFKSYFLANIWCTNFEAWPITSAYR